MLSNKINSLLIFLVLCSGFGIPTAKYSTIIYFITISTSIQFFFFEAAQFYSAFGFINISFSRIKPNFTTFTISLIIRFACLAICTTTTNISFWIIHFMKGCFRLFVKANSIKFNG